MERLSRDVLLGDLTLELDAVGGGVPLLSSCESPALLVKSSAAPCPPSGAHSTMRLLLETVCQHTRKIDLATAHSIRLTERTEHAWVVNEGETLGGRDDADHRGLASSARGSDHKRRWRPASTTGLAGRWGSNLDLLNLDPLKRGHGRASHRASWLRCDGLIPEDAIEHRIRPASRVAARASARGSGMPPSFYELEQPCSS